MCGIHSSSCFLGFSTVFVTNSAVTGSPCATQHTDWQIAKLIHSSSSSVWQVEIEKCEAHFPDDCPGDYHLLSLGYFQLLPLYINEVNT